MEDHRFTVRLGLGALVITTAVGCAQQRDPINRIGANALSKEFFVGADLSSPKDDPEFYASSTVVDVPANVTASLFTGSSGELRRIKWEISEKVLNARLTYENIQNLDGKGARETNDGQVIASFDIESHFDVKREYNPQTGEELNIISENSTDRPWYQRGYMRVDWSSNKIVSAYTFDPLASFKADGQTLEPLTYRVDNPSDPDAPVFDAPGGYFDVTNKIYVKPSLLSGQPACQFYGAIVVGGTYPYGGCDSSEIKVRLSFLRMAQPGDPAYRDYQVQEWDGARFNAHGAFTRDRLGYDRHYGIIDSKWHRLIQRYNIWQKSHTAVTCARDASDSHVDVAPLDGTEDQCAAAGAGSRCDEFVGFCTIPFAQRQTRPNAWHYNLNGDDEVAFESTNLAAEEWDTALREAVQAARRVECERTAGASVTGTKWEATVKEHSGDPSPCDAAFPIVQTDDAEVASVRAVNRCWKAKGRGAPECAPAANSVAAIETMIALCHSPVRAGDDPMCGPEGLVTRPGDLRYHQVNVVPIPQAASPWGYGPTAADPLTGEVIQASINVWNSVTDQTAQLMVDQIRWINGEIAADKVTSGDYVQDWARAASGHAPGSSPLMTSAAIDQRILGTSATSAGRSAHIEQIRRSLDMRKLNQTIAARSTPGAAFAQPGATLPTSGGGTAQVEAAARIALAKGTPTEAALVTPAWLDMAGVDKNSRIDDNVLDRASPLRSLDGETIAKLEQKVNSSLAAQGQCLMQAPEPNGITALAKIMAKKFPYSGTASSQDQASRVDQMWNYLRGKLNYAVIAHEMGHTVGLRHNFTSSFDKFNYRPQYWQLRTHNGEVTTPCTGPVADGSKCVGPRYFDPLDQDESDQLIWMWSQTSIMDYAGDMTQDTIGIGVYDYSAARAFYGDVVDVRNDGVTVPASGKTATQMTSKELIGREMFDLVDTAVQPLAQAFVTSPDNKTLHYSEWNNFFHMLDPQRCHPADVSPPAGWNEAKDGVYDAVFDGHIVLGTTCDRIPVDYVDWRDMVADTSFAQLVNYDPRWIVTRRALDKTGRPRMPYAFGTDDSVEAGIPSTYQHDNGADIYEEVQFHDSLYEDRHIFDNFRRGRVNFSIYGAYQRAVSRYHGKISSLAEQYSFIHDFILRDSANGSTAAGSPVSYSELVEAYEGEGGPLRDFAMASALAFDHFVRVATRPQPGPHSFVAGDSEVIRPLDGVQFGSPHQLDIPQGSMGIGDGATSLTDVSYGGRPIQNSVVSSSGYYNVNQAGSYYEKTHAIYNIVAQGMGSGNWSRAEGIDSRWLSSNFSNLYPDGVRRLLGVLVTDDQVLYSPRIATRLSGFPDVTWNAGHTIGVPARPLGWVSFVSPEGPQVCWPTQGMQVCANPADPASAAVANAPSTSVGIDPELGFEIQKFVLFYSYVFLPASQRNDWVDMLRIFKLGTDTAPAFDPAEMVEWKDPQTGYRYLAKRFGNEQLFGKTYDKGIGAKMVQWANYLASKAYVPADAAAPTDPQTGRFIYKVDDKGLPVVQPDSLVAPSSPTLTCDDNHYCVQLRNYRALLDYSRETAARVGFPDPSLLGIYAGQPQP